MREVRVHGPAIVEVCGPTDDLAPGKWIQAAQCLEFKANDSLHDEQRSGALGANEHVYLRQPRHQHLELMLLDRIYESVPFYEKGHQVKLGGGTDLEVIRYGTGGAASLHADICRGLSNPVSALVYFNDDYEGGELEFPDLRLCFKPAAGSTVFFPAHFAFMHQTQPLRTGVKYVAYMTLEDEWMRSDE